ncbi:hypothetical protein VOLCADRAFT_43575, partial [Volvox carteri f. nagariensis]
KLAVLGLPWETTEDTLKAYFSQYGTLECAEVMKDRYTGKSRGFGFVTFIDPASATRALSVEHTIDGRRCEAKVALPKGEPSPPRTTRIFVARIPPSVTESQFKQYFEGFGKLQDAYMPKDHSKQGYRGIGFVTFASPDSVEKVMAVKHWMNGHEIAIDRATPKEEPAALKNIFARLPMGPGQRRSFDNEAGGGLARFGGGSWDVLGAEYGHGAGGAGPRIFIGKLTKDTGEADVKEYFMRFGYVMDVYLPKAKDNKAEHRGFGFVTFETDAAIQRVVSHGQHRLKGSTIAIDIAMPKVGCSGG